MARQKGIIKLQGEIGDISFYKTADGFLAREKSGIDADRIKNDPAFQRTRENGAEFGRAGKASKVLRTAFRELLLLASDSRVTSRLTKEMMRILKTDAVSARGARTVAHRGIETLTGFEFNINGLVAKSFFAPYVPIFERTPGAITINIPSFIPANVIKAPAGATHFKLLAAGGEIDFELGQHMINRVVTQQMPLNHIATGSITLEALFNPNSRHPLFSVFGIEFYQQVNGQFYTLNNGAFNGLTIAGVNGVD